MNIRIKLKQFRIGLNLTQAEMAKSCDIALSTYGDIERGETDGPLKFWRTLMTKFNLSPEEICDMQYEGK